MNINSVRHRLQVSNAITQVSRNVIQVAVKSSAFIEQIKGKFKKYPWNVIKWKYVQYTKNKSE